MKKTKQCPKCQSIKIGWLEDPSLPGERNAVGFHDADSGFFGEPWEFHGALEALVCTSCGFYEKYVTTPDSVPWDKIDGFHWVNAEPHEEPGPYR